MVIVDRLAGSYYMWMMRTPRKECRKSHVFSLSLTMSHFPCLVCLNVSFCLIKTEEKLRQTRQKQSGNHQNKMHLKHEPVEPWSLRKPCQRCKLDTFRPRICQETRRVKMLNCSNEKRIEKRKKFKEDKEKQKEKFKEDKEKQKAKAKQDEEKAKEKEKKRVEKEQETEKNRKGKEENRKGKRLKLKH